MTKILPTGTVTFLFTDIEGSTSLAQECPDRWESLRERHDSILRKAIEKNNGYIFQVIGDAICAAFHRAGDALKAALHGQFDLQHEAWGETAVRVRMGIHTGEAETSGQEYRGYLTMSLVQRVVSAGHGGQILVSQTTENLLRGQLPNNIELRDMGKHKLKDVPLSTRIFQVVSPDLQTEFPALRTLSIFPSNLPTQITSFIGREKEIADVKKLLLNSHMLTVVGPGGTGKTRLAIQVASDVLGKYPDGVWLVELASIRDPLLVPRTVAIVLGLRDEPQRPVIDMLCDYLREKKMLILLDNCEHLIDACAQLAEQILRKAPNVRILASSREALDIAGEVTYRVPSLEIPDMDHLPPAESLSQYEAVKLFIDRAISAIPTFSVTNDSAPFLAQICHRLDGIPLAIELAAAKIRVLSVEEIARRLDDRFQLLTGGSRTALERHQTLRAAIDWSYNLLPNHEQILFRRLSVFVGGWTLEAAESVCRGKSTSGPERSEDVLTLLEHLINKSLVTREETPTGSRYKMLETMRQYASEKLTESNESKLLQNNHLKYFLNLAETAEPHLRRTEQVSWLKLLDSEYQNLRAALSWAMDTPPAESILRLAGSLGTYWKIRSSWLEGAKWLDRALSNTWEINSENEISARAKVFYRRADIAHELDDLETMKNSSESALALCENVKDAWGTAYSRALVASHFLRLINFEKGKPLLEQSLNEFKGLGDTWGESFVLGLLGRIYQGDESSEREYFDTLKKRIALARKSGDRHILAYALANQVKVHISNGECSEAEAVLQETDRLFTEIGSSYGFNQSRYWRTQVYFGCGEIEKAKIEARLFVDYCQSVGEKNLRGTILSFLGLISETEKDFRAAFEYSQKSLDLAREVGSPDKLGTNSASFGRHNYLQGKIDDALRFIRGSLEIVKKSGTEPNTISFIFLQIGGMFIESKPRVAMQLLGFSEKIWQTLPSPRNPILQKTYGDQFLSVIRNRLSKEELESDWETGLRMNLNDAVELTMRTLTEIKQ